MQTTVCAAGTIQLTHYYLPTDPGMDVEDHNSIDAIYLEDRCSCSQQLVGYLAWEGIPIIRDRVQNLTRRMRSQAIRQNSHKNWQASHLSYEPKQVRKADQTWATDITYIPL